MVGQSPKNFPEDEAGRGRSGMSTGADGRIHYLVGGLALSALLAVFYAFFFEEQAPPFLQDRELDKPRKLEVSGERPVIIIEDVDFGDESDFDAADSQGEKETSSNDQETSAGSGEIAAAPAEPQDAEPEAETPPAPVPEPSAGDETADSAGLQEKADSAAPALGAASEGDYVVQIIATRSAKTARQIAEQTESEGLRTYIEPVEREEQTLHRVRVGPFASRGDAELAKRDLHALGYPDSVIIDLR